MKMTYGQTVAARGPEIAAAEIDRLQRKIVAAQQVVDQNSKASAILFLDEHQWDQSSYAAHQKGRSEEHTSELQSLMRISYAVFCLKKNKHSKKQQTSHTIPRKRQDNN